MDEKSGGGEPKLVRIDQAVLRPDLVEREKHRERVSSRLAYLVVGVYIATLVAGTVIAILGRDSHWALMKDILLVEAPFVGVILGFYFSQKRL